MQDARIAEMLTQVKAIEREAVGVLSASRDGREREVAEKVRRQAIALKGPLSTWVAERAERAAAARSR